MTSKNSERATRINADISAHRVKTFQLYIFRRDFQFYVTTLLSVQVRLLGQNGKRLDGFVGGRGLSLGSCLVFCDDQEKVRSMHVNVMRHVL